MEDVRAFCESTDDFHRREEHTLTIGQRRETLPYRDTCREIQHISENRIALWAWWVWQTGFPPPPGEGEDKDTKRQCAEQSGVKHNGGGRTRESRVEPYRNGAGRQSPTPLARLPFSTNLPYGTLRKKPRPGSASTANGLATLCRVEQLSLRVCEPKGISCSEIVSPNSSNDVSKWSPDTVQERIIRKQW